MGFLRDGLSLDETRISSMIICLLVGFGLAAYFLVDTGDVPQNWLNLVKTLIYCVAGVNAIDKGKEVFRRKEEVERKMGD